jgi:hypothetical protein
MRAAYLWSAIVALLALSCAEEWPPDQRQAREHFRRHRSEIENLVRAIDIDGLESIGLTGTSPPVLVLSESGPLSPQRQEEWAAMLRSAGVDDARRDGADYFFRDHNPLGFLEGVGWDRVLVRRAERVEPDHLCASVDRSEQCGNCSVLLAEHWYLHYVWYPKDDWQQCLQDEPGESGTH